MDRFQYLNNGEFACDICYTTFNNSSMIYLLSIMDGGVNMDKYFCGDCYYKPNMINDWINQQPFTEVDYMTNTFPKLWYCFICSKSLGGGDIWYTSERDIETICSTCFPDRVQLLIDKTIELNPQNIICRFGYNVYFDATNLTSEHFDNLPGIDKINKVPLPHILGPLANWKPIPDPYGSNYCFASYMIVLNLENSNDGRIASYVSNDDTNFTSLDIICDSREQYENYKKEWEECNKTIQNISHNCESFAYWLRVEKLNLPIK